MQLVHEVEDILLPLVLIAPPSFLISTVGLFFAGGCVCVCLFTIMLKYYCMNLTTKGLYLLVTS